MQEKRENEFLLSKGCRFIVKRKYFNFRHRKTIYERDVILSK